MKMDVKSKIATALSMLAFVGANFAFAATWTDAYGVNWSYTVSEEGKATITDVSTSPGPKGHVDIPGTLDGNPVTAIGARAFELCTEMTSVTIPGTVTSIGEFAFSRCWYLEKVDIPASVTSIGEGAFWLCYYLADDNGFVIVRDTLHFYYDPYYEADADVTIPAGVTAIGKYAFWDGYYANEDVMSVKIPPSVTRIGEQAFESCIYLTEATIPTTVTDIGHWAFHNTALNTVHVGAGDVDRVKGLLTVSGYSLSSITSFNEDVPPPCTITLNANGGSVSPTSLVVYSGVAVGNLPVPTLAGYLFAGWFTSSTGGAEISTATVAVDGATYYAHWTEITAATWFTRRDDALAEAKRTGKKVFLIRGRDTCGNTMFTKNTSCEDSSVKGKLTAKCVLWYSNIDGPYGSESSSYAAGFSSYTLPLVCIIDPNDAGNYLKRSTGPLSAAAILETIADLPYPATPEPGADDPGVVDPGVVDPGADVPGACGPGTAVVPGPSDSEANDSFRASTAVTLMGAVYNGNDAVGIVEIKIGKLSYQEGRVSGTVTLMDGKKYTVKSQKCSFSDKSATTLNLDVKTLGSMRISVGNSGNVNVFSGELGKWRVRTANVGGNWNKASATASVTVGDVSVFGDGVRYELLPIGETATVSGNKWIFNKAAGVRWAKPKGETEKQLIVDTSRGKTNNSGMKLTYTPKKGTFKGSFKVYALQSGKLKKFNFNVNGVVLDGVGYGEATCKKPAVNWAITVE